MRLDKDSMFKMEAVAVLKGLQIAREAGFIRLELKCDNTVLIELILAGNAANNPKRSVASGKCEFNTHNKVADYMVKIVDIHRNNLQIHKDPQTSIKAFFD